MNKKINSIVAGIILSISMPFLNAQDCRLYFPDKVGGMREMKFYDQKNNLTSIGRQEILDKTVSGKDVSIKVRSTTYTAEDSEVYSAELDLLCENGIFKFDMKNFLDPNTMATYKEMGVEISGDNLAYPPDLKTGDALPDGNIKMVVKNNEITLLTITVAISGRTVDSREELTTDAGKFSCYKIKYNTMSKVGFITVNTSAVEWIAEGVGVVRNETYNKKGKLTGYSVLTKYNN